MPLQASKGLLPFVFTTSSTTTTTISRRMSTVAARKSPTPVPAGQCANTEDTFRPHVYGVHGAKSVRVNPGDNPYKVVATDMDGTLLSTGHNVSEYTRRVLSQLLARGVHVIFATGRPFTDVNRIKRGLNIFAQADGIPTPGIQVVTPASSNTRFDFPTRESGPSSISAAAENSITSSSTGSVASLVGGLSEKVVPRCFAVTSNGACVYDESNRRVYERCIDPRICRELYDMFLDDPEVNVNAFRGVDPAERTRAGYSNPSDLGDDVASEEWVSRYPSDLEAALYHNTKFTYRVVPNFEQESPSDHVNEIFFLCYNLDKSAAVEAAIVERIAVLKEELKLDYAVRVAPSAPYCLDIIAEDVSKASALDYVLTQVGLSMEDVIAFGDGLNDIEMLTAAGKGCIMANANKRLKKALPDLEVIGDNDHDGVARKLAEVFGLDVQ